MNQHRPLLFLLAGASVALAWSAIRPFDYGVWFFEVAIGLAGIAVLLATYRRFRLSGLVYVLVCIHFVILAVGAKYTYAEMPLFNWLRDVLDLSRNHYDRVGHFAQGFFPAIIARELLLRTTGLRPGKMLFFLVVCVCLALSAFYELIEWWVVIVFYPEEGAEWLGLQGDVWDPHWDMTMAMSGAILSLLLLSRLHNRSMRALGTFPKSEPRLH